MDKKNRQSVIYAMSAAVLMMLLQNWLPGRPVNVFSDSEFDQLLKDRQIEEVQFTGVFESTWLPDLLSWVLPALFFFALWWFFVRRFAEKQG